METVVSPKECLEFVQFAQYEAVLVDSDSLIFADALALVRLLRQESSNASLFVFSRYLDLEQRLLLFEAGADGCVREPFFASELAVRLGLSIRLRQAASDGWRSVAEKRRIVELTLVPSASVALVARAHGVNANQVFKWRRDGASLNGARAIVMARIDPRDRVGTARVVEA